MLKREEILSKTALKTVTLSVPEWGGDIVITEMSGVDRDAWEQSLRIRGEEGQLISYRAKLIAYTVVDEKGNRLFQDDDIEGLGKLSAVVMGKVCEIAMELNGLADNSIDKAKKN